MLNVNKITSTLARMPDQQLQQYAQMHKNDPYIMALAMSESNRRKELRAASQSAQGMQEPPKVVDQMVAEMAPRPAQPMPENMGIGQLPAGNMNFAEGGIIAFGNGGDVERYQDGGLLDSARARAQAAQQKLYTYGLRQRQQDPTGFQTAEQEFAAAEDALQAVERQISGGPAGMLARSIGAPVGTPVAPMTGAQPAASTPPIVPTQTDVQRGGATAIASPPPVLSPPPAPKGNRLGSAGPVGLGGPAPALAAQADTGLTDIDALQRKYFGGMDQDTGTLRNARAGLVAGIKDLAAQNEAATKAGIEARGDVFKGREERLSAREKGIEGMGDKNMGLALLQAGAAMMSTPGGLGVALGKGVAVGSERYAAGLDKINAAKDRFADARDRLDDLRINRDDMNTRDIRAAEKEAREAGLKGQELLYNGLVSDLGVKQKNVSSIFAAAASALEKGKDIALRERTAQMQESGASGRSAAQIAATLNTPDRLVFNQLLKSNNNNAVAAAEALQKLKTEKFSLTSSYADYLKAFAGKETLTPPLSLANYAAQFGAVLPR